MRTTCKELRRGPLAWARRLACAFLTLACAAPSDAYVRFGEFGQYDSPGNFNLNNFDIYTPNSGIAVGAPTIIDIHGGGYTSGDKAVDWQFCGALADRGYNVVSMNYTLAVPNVSSSFPQTFRDVRAMIRWVRTEGVQHGLSPTIVIVGHSAGATIGLAAAYAPEIPEFLPPGDPPPGGYRVDAAVGFFGRYDLVWDAQTYGTSLNVYNYLRIAFNQPGGPERFAAAAARTYVGGCSPPTKLVVGDADAVVPMGNSIRLAGALTNAGVFNLLNVVAGAGHGTGVLGSPIYLADAVATDLPRLLAASNPMCGLVAPSNDQCVDARVIAPASEIDATTIGATSDGASPCGAGDTRDVWFRFTPPELAWYTFTTAGTTGLARTSITVFDGCQSNAAKLGCAHAPDAHQNQLRLLLAAGAPVVIRVAGDGGSSGVLRFGVDGGEPYYPPPINDTCAGATEAGLGFTLGTTLGSAISGSGPCGFNDVADAWFRFVAPEQGRYRFDTLGSIGLPDTTIAVYSACGGAPLTCNDNTGADVTTSRTDLLMQPGAAALVRIAGNNFTAGSFVVGISRLIPATGACCEGGVCTTSDADLCVNGVFTAGQTCAAVPCNPIGQAPGACCTGAACTITDAGACAGSFQGTGATCGTAGNPIACCPANFNRVGGVGVQDVFDFLAAYFQGLPAADINRDGVVGVQDIFDFVSAYFTPCT